MKEMLELRVNYDYANLLFNANEGKNLGTSVRIVEISKNDSRYDQIPIISKQLKLRYNKAFFFGWQIKRKYSNKELTTARILHLKIKSVFEPAGEECGTLYDETFACNICGANRKQKTSLMLNRGTIPKKDIAKTIAGEVVVSEKFARVIKQRGLKGILLEPIIFKKGVCDYYQLVTPIEVELSPKTLAGGNPWDFSESSEGGIYNISGYEIKFEKEVYKCPRGHTIGLNPLSELYIFNTTVLEQYDLFVSRQKSGVKRGLLRPEPFYFCSQEFRKMVKEEKLSGFDFEIPQLARE